MKRNSLIKRHFGRKLYTIATLREAYLSRSCLLKGIHFQQLEEIPLYKTLDPLKKELKAHKPFTACIKGLL